MELPFEVEGPETITAGDAFEGQVVFRHDVPELAKVKAVNLRFEAYVHGSGTAESVAIQNAQHPGALAAPAKLPFRFQVPDSGPLSYQGRYVKIEWRLTVTLDVAWAIDPKIVRVVQVLPRRVGAAAGQEALPRTAHRRY